MSDHGQEGEQGRTPDVAWHRKLLTALAQGWQLVLAAALIVAPLAFSLRLLSFKPVQLREPASIGIVPPVEGKPNRGISVGVAVELDGCEEPVRIAVIVAGTAEYWLDQHRRLGRTATLKIALPGANAKQLKVTAGAAATDVLLQTATTGASSADQESLQFRPIAVLNRSKRAYASLAVAVAVRDWARTLAPVVIRYETTSWLEKRGLGSCSIRLPAVTGALSVLASQQANQRAQPLGHILPPLPTQVLVSSHAKQVEAIYRPGLGAQLGYTTVSVKGGSIATGESLPSPDKHLNGSSTWTCRSRANRAGLLDRKSKQHTPELLVGPSLKTTGALSIDALRDASSSDCSAVAVVVESSAALKRDAILLVTGALLGVGAALLSSSLFDRLRTRLSKAKRGIPAERAPHTGFSAERLVADAPQTSQPAESRDDCAATRASDSRRATHSRICATPTVDQGPGKDDRVERPDQVGEHQDIEDPNARQHPGDSTPCCDEVAMAAFDRGVALQQQGDWAGARAAYQEAKISGDAEAAARATAALDELT